MPKIVNHEQYRQELLHKSFDLFAERGYGSITMRQIAQGLGVSTGTLYHYFPSKEALFEQLVVELEQQDMLQITAQIKNAKTFSDRIAAGFDLLETHRDYFFKQLLIYTDFYQHQSRQADSGTLIFEQVAERVRLKMAQMFDIHDDEILDFVMSFVDGLILSRICRGDSISFRQQGQILTEMLLAYRAKRGQGDGA